MPTRARDSADVFADAATAFPAVDLEAWRRRVEEELGEPADTLVRETREGVDVVPLETAETAPAALPADVRPRRRGWRIAEEYRLPEIDDAERAIAEGQDLGVELLWLKVAWDRGFSLSPEPVEAIPVSEIDELERLMTGVDLGERAVVLETPGEVIPPAAAWVAAARRLGFAAADLRGAFGCDPLASPTNGRKSLVSLAGRFAFLADLTAWANEDVPGMRSVLVSTGRYHEAGASAVDELALAAAGGVESLRRLTEAGLAAEAVARKTFFCVHVGCDVFVEIAKLRALRRVWAKILRGAGVGETATFVHARGSARSASLRDPRTNLLRGGAQAFAAAVGGADSIEVTPYDKVLGQIGERGRRLALTTQHVLSAEAHLGRVADPAGGSWCLEALTDRLARAAWERFRDLERHGGLVRCLKDGRVREIVRGSGTARYLAATHVRDPLIGVSAFVDLNEPPPERRESEPADPEDWLSDVDRLKEVLERNADAAPEEGDAEARDRALHALKLAVADIDVSLGEKARRTVAAFEAGVRASSAGLLFMEFGASVDDPGDEGFEPLRLAEPFERLRDRSDRRVEEHGDRPRTFLARFGDRGPARAVPVRRMLAAAGIESVEGGPFEAGETGAVLEAFAASRSDFAVLCAEDDLYPGLAAGLLAPLQSAGALWVMVAGRGGEHHETLRAAGIDDFLYDGCDLVTIARFLYDELDSGEPS